ncbi:hypothetical protein GBAR_LOCUS11893 [Geodia barretti]|uniref:Glutaredoxin domain-containing protein n=1 Tax=Geodia barretti TaxID=519541 RepID=A0AA35RY01_GEOBA|nr:hypothetical protein GBAR_LOCUS11893 [Geodia barretti]
MTEANITVYGAPWCPDCTRAKQFLGEQRVDTTGWILIRTKMPAHTCSRSTTASRSFPPSYSRTGQLLVEPSNSELAAKLGIHNPRRAVTSTT